MIAEFNLDGVFVPTAAASAVLAFVVAMLLRKLLGRLGLHRLVWHPALFDTAVFVLLWAAISALPIGI